MYMGTVGMAVLTAFPSSVMALILKEHLSVTIALFGGYSSYYAIRQSG